VQRTHLARPYLGRDLLELSGLGHLQANSSLDLGYDPRTFRKTVFVAISANALETIASLWWPLDVDEEINIPTAFCLVGRDSILVRLILWRAKTSRTFVKRTWRMGDRERSPTSYCRVCLLPSVLEMTKKTGEVAPVVLDAFLEYLHPP